MRVGRFYRPGDPRHLADIIQELAGAPDVVARAGREARRLAESRYSWDGQAGVVDDLLHRVTAGRVTSGPR